MYALIATAAAMTLLAVFQLFVIVSLIRRLADESAHKAQLCARLIELLTQQRVMAQADEQLVAQALNEAEDAKDALKGEREAMAEGAGEAQSLDEALKAAPGAKDE